MNIKKLLGLIAGLLISSVALAQGKPNILVIPDRLGDTISNVEPSTLVNVTHSLAPLRRGDLFLTFEMARVFGQ